MYDFFVVVEFECEHCVLQWKYVAGNNWGICSNGEGAVGCGPQEEFRACADIAIGKGAESAIPTMKPPSRVKPTTEKWPPSDVDHETSTVSNEDVQKPPQESSNVYGVVIAIFTFFLVLCALIAIYIYFYHGDFLKGLLQRQESQQKPTINSSAVSTISSSPSEPPVRPPRTKRLSQTLKDTHNDHSSIVAFTEKSLPDV